MDRETTPFELPFSKVVVVLKSYITGREQRAITNAMLSNMKGINMDGEGGMSMGQIDTNITDEAENIAWRTVVVTFDGKTDGQVTGPGDTEGSQTVFNLVDAILDLRSEDYKALVNKIKEISNPEKKTST